MRANEYQTRAMSTLRPMAERDGQFVRRRYGDQLHELLRIV